MTLYQRAVPVLQVADVKKSLEWYRAVLGFAPDPFPPEPPHSFAMLRRDDAEIMLQRSPGGSPVPRKADGDFVWSVYLRITGEAILELGKAVAANTTVLRGPERMPYGLVELEIADPDGYRVCLGGEAPRDAAVKAHEEGA